MKRTAKSGDTGTRSGIAVFIQLLHLLVKPLPLMALPFDKYTRFIVIFRMMYTIGAVSGETGLRDMLF